MLYRFIAWAITVHHNFLYVVALGKPLSSYYPYRFPSIYKISTRRFLAVSFCTSFVQYILWVSKSPILPPYIVKLFQLIISDSN